MYPQIFQSSINRTRGILATRRCALPPTYRRHARHTSRREIRQRGYAFEERAKNTRNFIDSTENRGNRVPFREFAQMQFPLVSPFNFVCPFIRDALFVRAPKRITQLPSRERVSSFSRTTLGWTRACL